MRKGKSFSFSKPSVDILSGNQLGRSTTSSTWIGRHLGHEELVHLFLSDSNEVRGFLGGPDGVEWKLPN